MPKVNELPAGLRPYIVSHKVDIEYSGGQEATGTCPFCTKENKFFVNKDNGLYSCKSCSASGNSYTFIRKLHEISSAPQSELEIVAEERRLDYRTLVAWGLVKSAIDHEWMLPSYSTPREGKQSEINNLFRWSLVKRKDGTYKRRLMATAELPTSMFGMQFWDQSKPDCFITEGPWDGMKVWETFRRVRSDDTGKLVRTMDPTKSLYKNCNVLSVPGCETFKEGWESPLAGKRVIVMYDNDYPRKNPKTGAEIPPAGYEGLQKTSRKIRTVAKSVHVLLWGIDGYNPNLPDGYDVRDLLGV